MIGNLKDNMPIEETLDPADWSEIRQLGHRMIDDMFDHFENLRDRPAWQPIPVEVKNRLQDQALPREQQNIETIYEDFLRDIRPYPRGNSHPRYWGWVEGSGTGFGVLADLLASGMNSNVNFGEQSAVYVELQVIDWCKEMLGFHKEATGILVSG